MATIQIADDDARVQYTQAVVANTTQLTIDYPFFSLDDINVIVTNAAGTDTILTRGTGTGTFAVVGVAVDDGFSGGYITLGDSYSSGTDVFTLFRDIPVERTTDFPTSGPFNISSLNTELDKIIAIEQELETKVTRTLQLADSDATVDLKLPNLDIRKGTTLAFNATTGIPEAGPTISGVNTVAALAADIATLADIEDGTVATDAISDTAAIAANVTTVAGISSNVTTVSGNTSNINTVAGNTTNINTVAGNNANVTTVAGISGNVTTVAGISADVTAVAGDATDIGTVSANIANVNTVAGISADVTTVAADGADIGVVAGISSNVTTVSGIAANVTTVAGNTANINAVAADATDIGTVATNIANVNTAAGISANITTVAGIASDVTAAATNASDISAIAAEVAKVITVANDLNEATSEIDTVANSIANVDLVGGSIANVNTVATNLTDINAFGDTYFISATAPASPTTGDLWFDTTASTMKVYDGAGFINAGSSVNGTSARYSYTATAAQTSFSATYDAGYVDVYLNGVKLVAGTDFTASDGSTVVLATGAALNDTVDIVGYGTFSVSSAVTLPDGVKASFGNSNDLQIYRDSGASVSWIWNTVGDLYIKNDGGAGSSLNLQAKTNEDSIVCVQDAGVSLFYDNSLKLSTTATGVDVTGTALAHTVEIGDGSAGGTSEVMFSDNVSGRAKILYDHSASPNEEMGFEIAGTRYMTIENGGNVGIGTASPSEVLEVYGTTPIIQINDRGLYQAQIGLIGNDTEFRGSSGNIEFYTGSADGASSTERMTITSTGFAGIGESSPQKMLHITRNDSDGMIVLDANGATTDHQICFSKNYGTGGTTGGNYWGIGVDGSENKLVFAYDPNAQASLAADAKVVLDSSGNLLVGNSVFSFAGSNDCVQIAGTEGRINIENDTTSTQYVIAFYNPNGNVGRITTSGSSTSYVTSSDYRLKTAVEYDWDATSRLKQLKPARFAWITDADTTVDGFLAHEVQDIVPEAISGTKDGMMDEEYTVIAATGDIYTPAVKATFDEDGVELTAAIDEVIHSADVEQPEELAEGQLWRETTAAVMGMRSVPDYQGIDQSKLVPLLCKTILELEARIAALEAV